MLNTRSDSHRKTKLQQIHDYIYRLDSTKNKWTNRKQPKAVLTWSEWKAINKNAELVEEDFQRARLLFEQDNRRAQLYHTAIWQNMIPSRTLTLDRKKQLSDANKLTDISYNQTVSFLEEIVADMDGLTCWLDAAAGPEYLDLLVTESIINNEETASLSVTWVPPHRTDTNNKTTVTLSHMIDQLNLGSDNLVIENPENIWDGQEDTFMIFFIYIFR